jgi:hypothetical protein
MMSNIVEYFKLRNCFIVGLLTITYSSSAFAYIDPGTGIMVLQSVLAVIATLFFYIKNPRKLLDRIILWFRRDK